MLSYFSQELNVRAVQLLDDDLELLVETALDYLFIICLLNTVEALAKVEIPRHGSSLIDPSFSTVSSLLLHCLSRPRTLRGASIFTRENHSLLRHSRSSPPKIAARRCRELPKPTRKCRERIPPFPSPFCTAGGLGSSASAGWKEEGALEHNPQKAKHKQFQARCLFQSGRLKGECE